jgi:hypothetical protein
MRNISEYRHEGLYESFALVPFSGDITVGVYGHDSYVDYDNCDIYRGPQASLICFKPLAVGEPTRNDFFVSNGIDNVLIQSLPYEQATDIISGEKIYPYSIYVYCNSVNLSVSRIGYDGVNDEQHTLDSGTFTRCDIDNSWGPITFYDTNSGYNLIKIRNVLSASGVAHIIRLDMNDTEVKNSSSRAVNIAARTIRGILRTIDEWSICSREPFNNTEEPAVRAERFLSIIGFNEQMIDDAKQDSPEMRVAQFIRGNVIPLGEFEENESVPASTAEHFKKILRYETVSSIVKNHPHASLIELPEEELQKEKSSVEEKILLFTAWHGYDGEIASFDDAVKVTNMSAMPGCPVSKTEFLYLCEAYIGYK